MISMSEVCEIKIQKYIDTVSEKMYNTRTDTVSALKGSESCGYEKNIGAQLALYPMPVTVIGAMNGDKHIGGEGVLCQRDQKN